MSDVSTFFCFTSFRRAKSFFTKCRMAVVMERPLTRCAPHSALISLHGTPQTFSVYDLKKVA